MATLGNPKAWIPYIENKDCSQGFCSAYCPQWCYFSFPPPPPFEFPVDNSNTPNFSPLVIAIIGILASAFLLVSYYTLISKYCGKVDSATREDHDPNEEELEENHSPSLHEPWHAANSGLDEALIKSITVWKYKKEEGLVEGTDCSVCLSEFEEDESLRLLPKCSHAFHLPCIDTWLKSHSSCPLCRANIVSFNAAPLPLPAPVTETPSSNEALPAATQQGNENEALAQDIESSVGVGEEEMMNGDVFPKTPLRAFSDLGNSEERDTIIEIRDIAGLEHVRRSFSMDLSCQSRLSVADILCMNQDEDAQCPGDVGSSKQLAGEAGKCSHKALHCAMSPVAMKRSFSSGGRVFLARHGRRRNTTIPV